MNLPHGFIFAFMQYFHGTILPEKSCVKRKGWGRPGGGGGGGEGKKKGGGGGRGGGGGGGGVVQGI